MSLIRVVFSMIWLMGNQKTLRDKAFKIVSDPKYDGYQRGLAPMVYNFFDKKSSGSGVATKPNCQFANEIYRQIIRKFKRRKVHSSVVQKNLADYFSMTLSKTFSRQVKAN